MLDLGRSKMVPDLARLRSLCIDSTNLFARSVWPGSVLDEMPQGKALDSAMLRTQSGLRGTLNSVWAEKCRINAKEAVKEQRKRAVRALIGKFKHIGTAGDFPMKDGTRRLINLPEEWSRVLSDADAKDLSGLAESMNSRGVLELFRKLRLGHFTSLPKLHGEALLALLGAVDERFGCPVWKEDDATVQLHLDFRCLIGGRGAQDALLASLTAAIEPAAAGKRFNTALLVAGVVARGAPLHLGASVFPEIVGNLWQGKSGSVAMTSLALELGPRDVAVRGVVTQASAPYALAGATHVLGDDFGYCNTSAQAVVKLDAPLDSAFFAEAAEWTKAQCRAYLETHAHEADPVEAVLHCGRDFLTAIERHAKHVDALRSEIDLAYNRLHSIKHEVCRVLAIPATGKPDLTLHVGDARVDKLLGKMGMLLKRIGRLKTLRRGVYRSVDGLKRSWFGWLANRKAQLARKHRAVVVREHLTVVAKEKEAPGYFGRTFNKMINNGAKGQYLRAASAKLRWFGIPEAVVQSFYTSSTDVRFGVVDRKQRRTQDSFVAKTDGRVRQADLNAACTIALYAMLKPLLPQRAAA